MTEEKKERARTLSGVSRRDMLLAGTATAARAARRGARPSSPASRRSAPASPGSACRAPMVFKAQESTGIGVWRREFTNLRAPLLYNLRADPFERGDESIEYEKWFFDRSFVVVPSQALVAKWLSSFEEFPIRQKPASFNLETVMRQLTPKN